MNAGRRRALRVLAGTGGGRDRGRGGPGARRPRAEGGPARGDGHALRHHAVHRLQGLRRRLQRGERPRARPRPGRAPPCMPLDLNGQTKNVIKLYKEGEQGLLHEGAVHALRRPGLRRRLHAALAAEGRDDGHRRATTRTTAWAAATARWPARSTCRSSSSTRRCRRSSSASCAATASGRRSSRRRRLQPLPRATGPPAARSARAGPSSTGSATSCSPRRSAGSPRTPAPTCPKVYGETEAGRDAGALPLPRPVREARACPTTGRRACPTPRTRSRRASTRASSRRWSLYGALGAVALAQPQEAQAEPGEEVEAMSSHAHAHAPVGGELWTRPFRILVGDRRPRRRHGALALRRRARRGQQPQRRLPVGHLDRLRRRHRHGPRLRRLRRRPPRLHPQQGRVPPARPPGPPHQPPRLRARGARGRRSTSGGPGSCGRCRSSSGAGRHSPAARGGPLRRDLRRWCCWSSSRPPSSRSGRRAATRACARSPRRAAPRRARPCSWIIALGILLPTMHQSSLGHDDAAAGPKLHPLWFTPWLPFLFLVNCVIMGFGDRGAREPRRGARLRPPARDRRCSAGSSKVAMWVAWFFVAFRVVDVALPAAGCGAFASRLRHRRSSLELALLVAAAAHPLARRPAARPGPAGPGGAAARRGRHASTASTSTSSASGRASTGATSRPCRSC